MTAKAGRPMRICGTLITPRWDWSDDYLAHVREHFRMERYGDSRRQWLERQAETYARWLAARAGVDLTDANKAVVSWCPISWPTPRAERRPVAVEFYTEAHWPTLRMWRGNENRREHVARIEIPNWDHVSTVESESDPQPAALAA
ncbi:MAG: hypothetical protein ACREER_05550 [Alphaproteobacteria bacterium]